MAIKEHIFTDKGLKLLSTDARLLFISLLCDAAIDGVFLYEINTFKKRYFPADYVDIKTLICELMDQKLVSISQKDGVSYCKIPRAKAKLLKKNHAQNTVENSIFADRNKNDIVQIFDYWKEALNHPRAKLDTSRNNRIKTALKTRTVEECKQAIDGCKNSKYHQGENKEGRIHDGIDLIFRNAEKIEMFIDMKKSVDRTDPAYGAL